MNPVISGLTQAMSLASMMQRMQLEKELIARNQKREERENNLQDLQTTLALQANPMLQPVEPGQTTMPGFQTPIGIMQQQGLEAPTEVDAPVGRTVEHGGQRYALRSRKDVEGQEFERKMQELSAVTNVKSQAAMQELQAKHGLDLNLEGLRQHGQNVRTDSTNKVRLTEGEENRKNQREIAKENNRTSSANSQRSAGATVEAAKIRGESAGKIDTRREVNGRDEKIVDLRNQFSQIARVLREGGTYDDGKEKIDLSVGKKGETTPARKALEGKLQGIMRKLRLLRAQNEGAELAGAGGSGGGAWEDFKAALPEDKK